MPYEWIGWKTLEVENIFVKILGLPNQSVYMTISNSYLDSISSFMLIVIGLPNIV